MDDDRLRLAQGLNALGVEVPASAQARLLGYRDLLVRWNRTYNLTAVREPAQMVERHLLDSLAVAPHLYGARILDVGSGAGLPGIPLALAQPSRHFVLLDSQAKRVRFLQQAVIELRLDNVEVVQARVEQYRPGAAFTTVVSRAFSQVADFIRWAGTHCAPDGILLAMKGVLDERELIAVAEPWRVAAAVRLTVPGLDAERHVVRIERRPFTAGAENP